MSGIQIPLPEGPQVATQGAFDPARADPAAFAEPMNVAAQTFNTLTDRLALNAARASQHEAAATAAKGLAQARLDMTQKLTDQQSTAAPGAPGFTGSFLQTFDDYAKQTLENTPGLAKNYLDKHLASLRSTLGDHALAFEANQSIAKQTQDLKDTVNLNANVLRTDDTQFEHVLGETAGAINSSQIPPDKRGVAMDYAKNTLAQSLIEGLNQRDPQRAQTALNDGTYDTFLAPGVKNNLIDRNQSILDRQQREQQAQAQATVKSQYDNEVAAIRDRGYGLGQFSPAAAAAAFGPDQGGALAKSIQDEQHLWNARQSVALTPWSDDDALIAKWQPGSPQNGGSDNYAAQAQRRDALITAVYQKRMAIQADPAAYVGRASPALAQAWKDAAADPSKMPAAVALSDQLQSQVGVPSERQAILSKSYAEGLVAKLVASPPDQAGKAMQDLATQYGDAWPRAFGDLVQAKLPQGYQVLASVDNPAARMNLVEAMRAGAPALKQVIGDPTARTVDQAVADKLAPFMKTLAGGPAPNGTQLAAGWQTAAQLLAYRLVGQGQSASDASVAAIDQLVGQKWDIADGQGYNARAPKGSLPQVENYASQLLGGLKPSDLTLPAASGADAQLPPEKRAAIYFSDGIQKGATWVSNRVDDGWQLITRQDGRPVLRADGTPVSFSFQDALATPAPSAAAQAASGPLPTDATYVGTP